MGNFVAKNGLISNNNSIITGSLNISGSITGGFFGTSSYVLSSSYALNVDTASFTTSTITSASYASSSTSSSYATTASVALNPVYAPTPGIGYISPTMYFGAPEASGTIPASTFGGLLLSPVLINRNCSLTTMSIVGALNPTTVMTCSFALYSNSTSSNLPEYLLFSGSFSSSVGGGTSSIYNVNVSPTLSLQSDTVYWVGFVGSANFRWYYTNNVSNMNSYTPLLGFRLSTSTIGANTSPNLIKTGSTYNAATLFSLPLTASQTTSSYNIQSLPLAIQVLPVLKVTY